MYSKPFIIRQMFASLALDGLLSPTCLVKARPHRGGTAVRWRTCSISVLQDRIHANSKTTTHTIHYKTEQSARVRKDSLPDRFTAVPPLCGLALKDWVTNIDIILQIYFCNAFSRDFYKSWITSCPIPVNSGKIVSQSFEQFKPHKIGLVVGTLGTGVVRKTR